MISNKEANNKRFVSYNEEIRQLWLENLDHTDSKVLSKGETWLVKIKCWVPGEVVKLTENLELKGGRNFMSKNNPENS